MSLVIIPEIILLDSINKGLAYVRENYKNAVDKDKTWLSYCFKDQFLGT